MFYWVRLIGKNTTRWIVALISIIIGTILYNRYPQYEYWQIYHALIMLIFLEIGYDLKNKKISDKVLTILVIIFICLIVCCNLLKVEIPYITQHIDLSIKTIPLSVFFAITGTAMIIMISKLICKNRFYEFLGKNSLVIYGLHVGFIYGLTHLLNKFFVIYPTWGSLAIFCLTLLSCYIMIILLNTKYLKFLIGKIEIK